MGRSAAAADITREDRDRSALAALAERIQPTLLARDQRLAVLPALEPLFAGGGLRRGSTVSVAGPGATSLALATAAMASQEGAWVAAVGFPSLGLAAAAEYGVALERLVLVADPAENWASVVAALVDAFEVVLVQASTRVGASDGRRLVARTRERDAVLVQVGSVSWPQGADVSLTVDASAWEGLGQGHGHLQGRRVTVTAGGRREAARPRATEVWLPSPDGGVEAVLPEPVALRSRVPRPRMPSPRAQDTAP